MYHTKEEQSKFIRVLTEKERKKPKKNVSQLFVIKGKKKSK